MPGIPGFVSTCNQLGEMSLDALDHVRKDWSVGHPTRYPIHMGAFLTIITISESGGGGNWYAGWRKNILFGRYPHIPQSNPYPNTPPPHLGGASMHLPHPPTPAAPVCIPHPVALLWQSHGAGIAMALPWQCPGIAMTLPCRCHGNAMALPCDCAMAVPRLCYGTAMALPYQCCRSALQTVGYVLVGSGGAGPRVH